MRIQQEKKPLSVFLFLFFCLFKVFEENIPGSSPYNRLHWEPNGSGSFSAASKGFK